MMSWSSPLKLAAVVLALSIAGAGQGNSTVAPGEGWQIAGTLISAADGQGLSHARVTLSSTSDRDFVQSILTGSDGRFMFRGLAAGKYVLGARRSGFVPQGYQQHGAFFTGIAVGPGLPVPRLLFRLQPESVISGKIVDEAGDPVRDGRVILLHKALVNGEWATRVADSAATDDLGAYHFGQLPAGIYFVSVSAQPWYARHAVPGGGRDADPSALDVAYPVTYYQGATDPGDATPIDLQAGERAAADITLTAIPAQHIILRLPEDSSESAFSAVLMQRVADASTVSVATAFQKVAPGVYESTGVPPGQFEMELQGEVAPGKQPTERTRAVEVGKGQAEVDLNEPSSLASVSGRVSFVAGARTGQTQGIMLVRPHSRDSYWAKISEHNNFAFEKPMPPGAYEVVANSNGETFIAGITASGASVRGRTLDITGSEPVKLSIVLASGIAQVTGTAVREGKPVSGALVMLVPADAANNLPLLRADQSDSDGTFALRAVVPGRYTVVAVDNGWGLEWRNPAALKPYLAHGEPLVIAPAARYNIRATVQDF